MMYFKGCILRSFNQQTINNNTIDLVISNCVLNLSPNKLKVMKERVIV